jgi:hypothetical protein
MFDVATNSGPRKGKRGRIYTEKMNFALGLEGELKRDVRGSERGGESRLVVGD